MTVWSRVFRVVALLLAFHIGGQIVMCELPGSDCSSVVTTQSGKRAVPTDAGDNCICCCAHPAPVSLFTVITQERISVRAYIAESVEKPHQRPSEIEHPPQLS